MKLSLIAALSRNRVIGRDNRLPWHLPADLARFKQLTMGHAVIFGRRTFESIGRPLPGRRIIVLSRRPPAGAAEPLAAADETPNRDAGTVEFAPSLEAAVERCAGDDEVFVGGGAQVYRLALGAADRMYLTLVHADVQGDTRFPDYDESEWRLATRQDHHADTRHRHAYSFLVYERRPRAS